MKDKNNLCIVPEQDPPSYVYLIWLLLLILLIIVIAWQPFYNRFDDFRQNLTQTSIEKYRKGHLDENGIYEYCMKRVEQNPQFFETEWERVRYCNDMTKNLIKSS